MTITAPPEQEFESESRFQPKLSYGGVIQGTFGVVRRQFVPLLIMTAATFAIPVALVGIGMARFRAGSGLETFGTIGFAYLTMMVAAAILQPALIHAASADLNGRAASVGECLRAGLRQAVPVFLILLLSGVAIGFGMILLLFPGFMLLTAWCVAGPARVVERVSVFEAFRRSAALTKHNRWRLFGLIVIYFIVYMAVQQTLANLAGAGALARTQADPLQAVSLGYWAVMAPLSLVNTLITYVGLAVIYFELRRVKEGVGPEALAAIFD